MSLRVEWKDALESQAASGAQKLTPAEITTRRSEIITQTRQVIDRRISGLGLAEATVQPVNRSGSEDELLIQLPGVDDPERIKRILGTVAVLEWLDVREGPYESREAAFASHNGTLPLGIQLLPSGHGWYLLARTPVIRGADLRDARAGRDPAGGWVTQFTLSQQAAKRFERYTSERIGQRAAIVLDHKILSVATIEARISDTGQITHMPSQEAAADLALNLRAGALPASLTYLGGLSVGPSLGADSIRQGLRAGGAGLAAVVTVMVAYYKRSGVNAVIALLLNALILLALLAVLEAKLTLPGIAGLILTIGMAVDSNVLIFERIREELRAGKAAVAAVQAGFRHAFRTIVDTHVTTVVSCGFLFLFGTSPIKGFAVTLVLGLLVNVFTSVYVSRLIFDWELWRNPSRAV
jgi:preprotein translocase subunit SecD